MSLLRECNCYKYVVSDMIRDWELYSVHQDLDPEVQMQKTIQAEQILGMMRNRNLSPKEPLAIDESKEATECECLCLVNWIALVCVLILIHALNVCECSASPRAPTGENVNDNTGPPATRAGGVGSIHFKTLTSSGPPQQGWRCSDADTT